MRRVAIDVQPTSDLFAGWVAQAAVAVPDEGGTMTVHSATQSLDAVQRAVAAALGTPFHQVLHSDSPVFGKCSQRSGWWRSRWVPPSTRC